MQAPVFDGYYRFVKGGIWKITEELTRINAGLGVRIETSSPIARVDELDADKVVLATDPVTAARLCGEPAPARQYLGTSGKLTLSFRQPVEWKDSPEAGADFPLHLSEPLALKRWSARRSRWWGR